MSNVSRTGLDIYPLPPRFQVPWHSFVKKIEKRPKQTAFLVSKGRLIYLSSMFSVRRVRAGDASCVRVTKVVTIHDDLLTQQRNIWMSEFRTNILLIRTTVPTTYGPQKFSKIRGLKVTYFYLPSQKLSQIENMTWVLWNYCFFYFIFYFIYSKSGSIFA